MVCFSSENNYFSVFYYNILPSFTNKETMEDHIQEAQQQIMESVKTQEHELCQQRWVIECVFFFLYKCLYIS